MVEAELRALLEPLLEIRVGGGESASPRGRPRHSRREIIHRALNNERILLQPGAFLASSSGLEMKMRWAGLRGLFGREGAVFIEMGGSGDLFFNAYGGIHAVEVDGTFIVDTGHMVAFDAGLDFKIKRPGGGLMGLFASGEGLVCEFEGKGTVWIQSRNMSALVGWLMTMFGR